MGWRVIALLALVGCGRIAFDPLDDAIEISVHGAHGCALAADGRLWCWGSNHFGQVGEGAPAGPATFTAAPVRVPNVPPFERVDTGEFNTFAVTEAGELWAWGANNNGQLGIGLVTGVEPAPRPVATNVESVAVSQIFTCAKHRDGTASCWGYNACGELGNGASVDHYTPQVVPGLSGITQLGVHDTFACAIDGAGALTCWGAVFAVCGEPVPPARVTLPKVVQVEGGCHLHLCALEEVGRVWCVGENQSGQLGTGTTAAPGMFEQVMFDPSAPRMIEIAVGTFHTCARSADHRVWCWGDNVPGTLGIGDASVMSRSRPQQLPFFDGSIAIDDLEAGCGVSCARSGRDLYCWGDNRLGQQGDGALELRFEPVKISLDLR